MQASYSRNFQKGTPMDKEILTVILSSAAGFLAALTTLILGVTKSKPVSEWMKQKMQIQRVRLELNAKTGEFQNQTLRDLATELKEELRASRNSNEAIRIEYDKRIEGIMVEFKELTEKYHQLSSQYIKAEAKLEIMAIQQTENMHRISSLEVENLTLRADNAKLKELVAERRSE